MSHYSILKKFGQIRDFLHLISIKRTNLLKNILTGFANLKKIPGKSVKKTQKQRSSRIITTDCIAGKEKTYRWNNW